MIPPYRLGTVRHEDVDKTVVESKGLIHFLEDICGVGESLLGLLQNWESHRETIRDACAQMDQTKGLQEDELHFLAPIPRPPKLICVGTNYHDHLREMKVSDVPEFPYAFLRPTTSLAGHREDVPLPNWPEFVDWEAELGIVIGRSARDVRGKEARDAIAGYTIINDISARDWIRNRPWVGIDWVMQKAWDKFQPTGPWFTPAEFVSDPDHLNIQLTVNDIVRQDSNTSEMIFNVEAIVEHLSAIMTLECGDLIATGTPAGVGFGQDPQVKLQAGDEIVVTIEQLGELHTRMVPSAY